MPKPNPGGYMSAESIRIVDDNAANLELARILLSSAGYTLRPDEAFATPQGLAPHLIVMDIQMPGVDGLTLTRRPKADSPMQFVKIIALTAYAMKGDGERAVAAGCDGYIVKPIDTRTLPAVVASYLEQP